MAPLGEVLEGAGFEVHAGYTAPAGTDWEAFDRIRHTASSAVRHGLSVDETHALVMVSELCRLYGMGMDDFDRDIAREVGGLLGNPDVAETFADAAEESEATMNFLAQTRRLAGRRDAANLAWIESLVAGRTGAPRSSMTGPSTTSSTSEGSLLPDDERNLVAQWALTERSVHEAVDVTAGEGFRLRDLRTGDVVDVRERRGSATLAVGDLICAHPVFDGAAHQLIGGAVPVPLLRVLDEGGGSAEVAFVLGGSRRAPDIRAMDGEPVVVCEGTYRMEDLERAARFERLRDAVTAGVAGLEPLDERRRPPAEAMRRDDRTGEMRGGGGSGEDVPAGTAEAVATFMRQQEERWVDEPVPALAGLTPRQAAADPTRREDLMALLHEFDRMPAPPGAFSFDTSRLRALLGVL